MFVAINYDKYHTTEKINSVTGNQYIIHCITQTTL